MKKKRNIEFLDDKIQYNAIRKFNGNIIKIPSYVIDEVFREKLDIEITHNNKLLARYSYDNLFHFIKRNEKRKYKGTFNYEPIEYHLTHVRV